MELKIAQGVRLTREQVKEIHDIVMNEPDMGWDYDLDSRESNKTNVYDVELSGEHGTYHHRVNLSWGLITIQKVT